MRGARSSWARRLRWTLIFALSGAFCGYWYGQTRLGAAPAQGILRALYASMGMVAGILVLRLFTIFRLIFKDYLK